MKVPLTGFKQKYLEAEQIYWWVAEGLAPRTWSAGREGQWVVRCQPGAFLLDFSSALGSLWTQPQLYSHRCDLPIKCGKCWCTDPMTFYKSGLELGSYFFGSFCVANSQDWKSDLVIFFFFSSFCFWFMIWIWQIKSCNSIKLYLCIRFSYIKRAIPLATTIDISKFELDLFARDLEIFSFKTTVL